MSGSAGGPVGGRTAFVLGGGGQLGAHEVGMLQALGARVLRILVPPAALIVLVLGSILIGAATPTEAAAMGSIGAILLAGRAVDASRPWPVYVGAVCLVALVPLTQTFDLRMQREVVPPMDLMAAVVAGLCIAALVWGLVGSLIRVHRSLPFQ